MNRDPVQGGLITTTSARAARDGVLTNSSNGQESPRPSPGIISRVRLLLDVLWVLRVATGTQSRYRGSRSTARSTMEHRELAQIMRNLPGRYADRLPRRTVNQIQAAAAAGQWEYAVRRLVTRLRWQAAPVNAAERDELRIVLGALDMPGDLADTLTLRP